MPFFSEFGNSRFKSAFPLKLFLSDHTVFIGSDYYLFNVFIDFRVEGRGRERNSDHLLLHAPLRACALTSTQTVAFWCQDDAQLTKPHQPGPVLISFSEVTYLPTPFS